MSSMIDVSKLVESLKISESANDSFDYLLGEIAELMEMASLYRAKGAFDPVAMIEYAYKVETTILASGHDPRIIRMCQVMLGLTGVSDQEFLLDGSGKVYQRQVYFVRRSDGVVKIGSTMNVARRMEQLSSGAAEDLELLGHINGSTLFEKAIHRELADHRKHGEWFYQAPEVIAYVERILRTGNNRGAI
ncbi:GIY-YIG nuclease family protein [Halomonas pacifica]|uniref:GIY-YIG nuclease family protein n=1 Tax=Bisbaumannia pacifica TaxID=77098 RepID=UPI00235A2D23|nr:GIY-YIG nuclease family protein [Halomonas pacifica]MDC8803941.1 GIY-YIG nuclease family protein [Halomonas pacifica]